MSNNRNPSPLPPKWLVNAIQAFRTILFALYKRLFPGRVVLYEQFQYLYLLPALYVAAEFNIAESLRSGKKSVDELARELNVSAEALFRVMRALAGHGIFRESGEKCFSNTRLSKPLMDGNESLRNMFRHHLSPLNWMIAGDLLETVKTGVDACNRIYGKSIYDYLSDHPDSSKIFDKSMSDLSSMGLAPILQSYSFSGLRSLADIGGGDGFMLANILAVNSTLQGILFDRQAALMKVEETFRRYNVSDRIDLVEGDFLQSVPGDIDGYLLKNILHNWDDQHAILILSNIRKAMPDHGKVIIIEMIVPGTNRPSMSKLIDIQMLASMPGGKERTRKEFEMILHEAGLTLTRVCTTIAPITILEAHRIV